MSTPERRLRRRRKVEKTFTSDSIDSDDELLAGEKIHANDDFQSASLSNESGEHIITKHKPKRRVLRRTNDFQNLNPSTQLDDKDNKVLSTKVKKSKKTIHLPQICDIEEEYEILQTKIKNRKRHKQKVASATINKEDMSSTVSRSDTDTSVPSESQLLLNDLENKQKTKRKNQRRRNRRCKRVQVSSTTCHNENESSVNTTSSDVASKPSDLLDSKEIGNRDLNRKSTSDSDSIVYSFRNRKRAALAESTVQNIISPKTTAEKSDDSVEYNYKRKRGKAIQKSTELEEGKELAVELNDKTTETRQQKHLAQSRAIITDGEGTKTLEETFESKSAYQSGVIDFQMKETRRSIMKRSAIINNGVTKTLIVMPKRRKNKNKSVQFQEDEPLNTLCEDLNEKNNTYELDKSKNDISVLKTVIVESNECFEDSTAELKDTTNIRNGEIDIPKPPNVKSTNEANFSNTRTFEFEAVSYLNVSKLASGEKALINDYVDSSFKNKFSNSDAKSIEANPSSKRRTFELEKSTTDLIVLKLASSENAPLNDNGDSSFKNKFSNSDGKSSIEANPSNRRTFELEESTTDLIVLKLGSGENAPLNDNDGSSFKNNFSTLDHRVKTKKSFSGSNTPFSRVTRRKKGEHEANPVNVIDDISPPESSSLPSTADDSSSEETLKGNKSIIKNSKETISSCSKRNSALSQSDQNLSSFGVSSTPLPKREGTYTVLNTPSNKKMLSTCKEVLLTGPSSTNKQSTRTKMPNFALIHKKAFEKMEDIEQLQQRKAERAKLLLSGAKPAVGFKLQSPRKIQNQNMLKPLNFGTKSLKYSEVSESPKPLCNTVLQNAFLINSPKVSRPTYQSVKYSGVNESPKPLYNSQKKVLNSPKSLRSNVPVLVNSPKVFKSTVQSSKFVNSLKVARSNLQSPKVKINTGLKLNQDTKEKPNKFKPTLLGKNMNSCGTSKNIHKPVIQENGAKHNIPTLPSTGITRYGFKTTSNPAKTITKQEQLKAVANKNNIVRNNVDERRNTIKGVRSNRRFELLMRMRNK